MLRANVHKRLREYALAAEMVVRERSVLVLVGESGSGKTTLLRLVAGLTRPDGGRVTLDERTLFDGTSGLLVPPEERPVGYVSQDYALFPHLTVFENVGFGLRAQGIRDGALRARVGEELERFGVAAYASRLPTQLSGGQQQRVALARALALEPRLLLLDEPLSALDLQTRRGVRSELRRWLAGRAVLTIYVTHSPAEALAFGDEIAVIERGRISQQGSREDLLRRPRSSYVAAFLGINLIPARVVSRRPGELARVRAGDAEISVGDPGREGEVTLVVRPTEITLSPESPVGSARNVLQAVIEEIVPEPPTGERLRVFLAGDPPLVAEISRDAADALSLRPGDIAYAAFKATSVTIAE